MSPEPSETAGDSEARIVVKRFCQAVAPKKTRFGSRPASSASVCRCARISASASAFAAAVQVPVVALPPVAAAERPVKARTISPRSRTVRR